jgi:hypothetical protein
MPRVRRRGHMLRGELTSEQVLELVIGLPGGFASEAKRRAAWFAHRDELMALLPPDGRGWAWVTYEGGGFLPSEGGRVTMALTRLDGGQP